MKALVVYDSVFGNTRQIAQAIGDALDSQGNVETLHVGEVTPERLRGVELLVVGSPTRGFRPTPATTGLLKRIPKNGLQGVRVAAFDTRFGESQIEEGPAILSFLVKLFGYAAEPISNRLAKKGGEVVVQPEGFIVTDTEGPLREGELDRAAEWARQLPGA